MSAEPGGAVGSELVLLGASDTAGLLASVRRLKHFVEQAPGANLSDVAFTCARDSAFSETGRKSSENAFPESSPAIMQPTAITINFEIAFIFAPV